MDRTEADRVRAYELLAVANPSPPLEVGEVGYIELVSSPDRLVAPMVFALEHAKVRLGRFTLASPHVPDVFVAAADDATAIAPMNMMFEYLDGRFHAFDTRSANGTFVNGEQIRKRRVLAPGDVIDIGGAPSDGGARVVFLGVTAPAGREIRRAPILTRHDYRTPRGGLAIEIDSAAGVGTARMRIDDDDWVAVAMAMATRVARISSPALPASTVGADHVAYRVGELLEPIPQRRRVDERTARAITIDICEAVAACHRDNIVVGPFDRRLVFTRATGRAVLFGAGLSRLAYMLDARVTGPRMLAMHFTQSPEELRGIATSAATDVWFAAAFLISLGNGGHEPFPTTDYMAYRAAVLAGAPADAPAAVARALSPEPRARPTLAAFVASLR